MRVPPFFRKSSFFREQFAVKQILKPLAPGGAQGIEAQIDFNFAVFQPQAAVKRRRLLRQPQRSRSG